MTAPATDLTFQEKDEIIRQLALRDCFYFIQAILEFKEITPRIHDLDMIRFINDRLSAADNLDEALEILMEIPRKHFKSSVVTIGWVMWKVIKDPNIRILINNKSLGNAKQFLYAIKSQFEKNEVLKYYFGDFVGQVWREDKIVVSKRTNITLKEPTIAVGSIGHEVTSGHFDIIINDDLVGLEDYLSEVARKHTLDFYRSLKYVTDKNTTIINIGTRWHPDDLYAKIRENIDKGNIINRSCYLDEAGTKLYFPERISLKELKDLEEEDALMFSGQMRNSPALAGRREYDPDQLKQFDLKALDLSACEIRGWCDLAYGKRQEDCFTAIPIFAIQGTKKYLLEWFCEKVPADLAEEKILEFMEKYPANFTVFGGEENGGQIMFYERLEKRLRNMPHLRHIQIKTKSQSGDKDQRIRLARRSILNDVYFRSDYAEAYPVPMKQLVNFPTVKYKDGPDSLADLIELCDDVVDNRLGSFQSETRERHPLTSKYYYRHQPA